MILWSKKVHVILQYIWACVSDVSRRLLWCAVTELAHEGTRLPYCITDRHIQPAHKKGQSQNAGLE
jgi:hypothetical protein